MQTKTHSFRQLSIKESVTFGKWWNQNMLGVVDRKVLLCLEKKILNTCCGKRSVSGHCPHTHSLHHSLTLKQIRATHRHCSLSCAHTHADKEGVVFEMALI